jgi:hypothetical protein
MKSTTMRLRFLSGLAVMGSALAATACGNTGEPELQPLAGRNHGGGGAAGSASPPQTSSTGARTSGGTGQTVDPGGDSPVAGGGGNPAQNPLLVGDDACPAEAPTTLACSEAELGASCVYGGLVALVHASDEPFRCVCDGANWACAQSDENGETTCPFVRELPGASDACPEMGERCVYWVPGYLGLADCSCRPDDSASGAAGAGGADAAPSSLWSCGL